MKPSLLSPLFTAGLSFSALMAQDVAPKVQEDSGPAPTVAGDSLSDVVDDKIYVGSTEFIVGLTKNLASKFAKLNEYELKQLAKDKRAARSIAVWKVVSSCSNDLILQIAQKEEGMTFLSHFLRDTEWMEGFLNSGPIPKPELALRYLYAIYKSDPELVKTPLYKKWATAVSLEFSRLGYEAGQVLPRYTLYRQGHQEERLNPVFDELDFWEMRIIAGCSPSGYGSVKSLKWQRDHIRVPAPQYTLAAWQVPYRLENYFGDSVHSSDYYTTFRNVYNGGQAEMSREVGAVCGGISHYGAYAAIANGIPAATMGEPGHCAFTVRVTKTDWEPANSISSKRGLHWNFYGSPWSVLLYTQKLHSDADTFNMAYRLKRIGDIAADAGDMDRARGAYITALQINPISYPLWVDYLQWEKSVDAVDSNACRKINDSICKYMAADYPELCSKLLLDHLYPVLLAKVEGFNDKIKEFQKFHDLAKKMGSAPWPMEKVVESQYRVLAESQKQTELSASDERNFMEKILSSHLGGSEYTGNVLAWCQKQVENDPVKQEKFFESISKMQARVGSVRKDDVLFLGNQIMLSAQQSGDIDTFQIVGKLLRKRFTDILPNYKRPPGEFLSTKGLVMASHYKEDMIEERWKSWGIVEKFGGSLTVGKDSKDPWVIVKLPCQARINGVVLVSKIERAPKDKNLPLGLEVQISPNGRDWTTFATLDKVSDLEVLKGAPIMGQQVRVKCITERVNWEVIGVHVFGQRSS